jgi:hypothetical protein
MPQGLDAQQTETDLQRHLDSIRPLAESARVVARAVLDALGEAARRRAKKIDLDTVPVGPLRIITPVDQRQLAEEIYAAAWSDFEPFITDLPIAQRVYMTFAWPMADGDILVDGDAIRMEVPWWRNRGVVEARTRQAIGSLLRRDVGGSRLGDWLTGEIHAPANPADTYRRLALRQAASIRSCLMGDEQSCWTAMGADLDQAEYPLSLWYSPEERQAKVRAREYLQRVPGPVASLYQDCLADAFDSCDEILQQMRFKDWNADSPTYNGGSRATFLWVALRTGGAGAWDRLRAHRDDAPGAALRAASGLEAGPLAQRWLEWMQANRPAPRKTFEPSFLFVLAWIGLFGAFAMRSERCRLG